jgi:hypothetical protein
VLDCPIGRVSHAAGPRSEVIRPPINCLNIYSQRKVMTDIYMEGSTRVTWDHARSKIGGSLKVGENIHDNTTRGVIAFPPYSLSIWNVSTPLPLRSTLWVNALAEVSIHSIGNPDSEPL